MRYADAGQATKSSSGGKASFTFGRWLSVEVQRSFLRALDFSALRSNAGAPHDNGVDGAEKSKTIRGTFCLRRGDRRGMEDHADRSDEDVLVTNSYRGGHASDQAGLPAE